MDACGQRSGPCFRARLHRRRPCQRHPCRRHDPPPPLLPPSTPHHPRRRHPCRCRVPLPLRRRPSSHALVAASSPAPCRPRTAAAAIAPTLSASSSPPLPPAPSASPRARTVAAALTLVTAAYCRRLRGAASAPGSARGQPKARGAHEARAQQLPSVAARSPCRTTPRVCAPLCSAHTADRYRGSQRGATHAAAASVLYVVGATGANMRGRVSQPLSRCCHRPQLFDWAFYDTVGRRATDVHRVGCVFVLRLVTADPRADGACAHHVKLSPGHSARGRGTRPGRISRGGRGVGALGARAPPPPPGGPSSARGLWAVTRACGCAPRCGPRARLSL